MSPDNKRAGYEHGDERGFYVGVIRHGSAPVWRCDHVHGLAVGDAFGVVSARTCARQELDRWKRERWEQEGKQP